MPSVKPGDTIAVTGANGLVASHCIKVLLAKGFDVAACVRDPTNETKVAHLKAMAELIQPVGAIRVRFVQRLGSGLFKD